jgi:Ca2+-binding EF-hand superfamily protein
MASLDRVNALLGPVQPDLSREKKGGKKMFEDCKARKATVEMSHSDNKKPERFFRKALDHYTHDESPIGKITDPLCLKEQCSHLHHNQRAEISTKQKISHEFLDHVAGKKLSENTKILLKKFLEHKVDYRHLSNIKTLIFGTSDKAECTLQEFKDASAKVRKAFPNEELEQMFIESISTDKGMISKSEFTDMIDVFQYVPIFIKRDKNKSESLYYVLNSNKRGAFESKEELLRNLKDDNDAKHLVKIMTLIAIKIEEKFTGLNKAFLFFDENGDREISKAEFAHSIDKMRIKLNEKDMNMVFDHLDKDGDGVIDYNEFCELAEEKRRNIDPFSQEGLNNSSLK